MSNTQDRGRIVVRRAEAGLRAETPEAWADALAAVDRREDHRPAFASILDRYLETHATCGYAVTYRSNDRLYLRPVLAALPSDAVSEAEAWAVRRRVEAAGRAPATVGNVLRQLRATWNQARREGTFPLAPTNPVSAAVLSGLDVDNDPAWRDQAFLELSELDQLLHDPALPPELRIILRVLASTGLRVGAAIALRVRDWQRERQPLGALSAPRQWHTARREFRAPKVGRIAVCPVLPSLAEALDDWLREGWAAYVGRAPEPDDLLLPYMGQRGQFYKRSRPWRADRLRRGVAAALRDRGLRHRTVHDVRRSFYTAARDAGVDADVVAAITHPRATVGRTMAERYRALPYARLCVEIQKLSIPYRRQLDTADGAQLGLPFGATP